MSYILNALRKSEQDRQSTQPDTLNVSALLPEIPINTPRRRWPMIGLFLGLNLLGLGYLYFKLADLTPVYVARLKMPVPMIADQDMSRSGSVTTLPVMPNTEEFANTPSISDLWAENQQVLTNNVKTPVLKLKPLVKKSVSITSSGKEKKTLRKTPLEKKWMNPVVVSSDDLHEAPEAMSVLSDESAAIPLLRGLSADLQAKLPSITLNVLAYADLPHERFVIIDMVKYKIGERIKAKVQLVDILPESVVMSFEGQRFRLERP